MNKVDPDRPTIKTPVVGPEDVKTTQEFADLDEYFTAVHHLLTVARHELQLSNPNMGFLAVVKDKIGQLSK